MRTINGIPVLAELFAYDGCHKIYLICQKEHMGRKDPMYEFMEEYGYDFYPIEDLPGTWERSCPLRFISTADLTVNLVDQCEPAVFEGFGEASCRKGERDA